MSVKPQWCKLSPPMSARSHERKKSDHRSKGVIVHRRSLIIIAVVALLAVTGLTVGLLETRAQGEPDLATVTPTELLANVAQHAGDVAAVSGSVSWKNDVLGLSMLSFGGQSSGDFTALLSSGSGRVWVADGKARFDILGAGGDTVIVGDSTSVWVYSSTNNTATEYTLPAGANTAALAANRAHHPVLADRRHRPGHGYQRFHPETRPRCHPCRERPDHRGGTKLLRPVVDPQGGQHRLRFGAGGHRQQDLPAP